MRALRTLVVVLLVCLGFLGGYFAGWILHGENVVRLSGGERNEAKKAGDLQQRVIEELQGRYYREVDVDELSQAGVQGMLKSLDDPYTVYLSPRETKEFEEKQKGEYSGIGASLQKTDEGLVITGVFQGSPAEEAGLGPGDLIVSVDGNGTADADIETSIARIKGEEGTKVTLVVQLEGGGEKELSITRRRIEIPETRREMKRVDGTRVGYVQLYDFGGNAARDVRRDVAALGRRGAEWYILDLRYNGGGLLSQAVDVAGVFITGVVTSTKGLHSPLEVLEASGPVVTDAPMVVLVNRYSASASEIVAGALMDRDRATVVGTRTFGKGLVQSIVPLGNDSSLKLTTAVYLTPSGTDINEKGITPHLVVKDKPKTVKDEQLQAALAYIARQP